MGQCSCNHFPKNEIKILPIGWSTIVHEEPRMRVENREPTFTDRVRSAVENWWFVFREQLNMASAEGNHIHRGIRFY